LDPNYKDNFQAPQFDGMIQEQQAEITKIRQQQKQITNTANQKKEQLSKQILEYESQMSKLRKDLQHFKSAVAFVVNSEELLTPKTSYGFDDASDLNQTANVFRRKNQILPKMQEYLGGIEAAIATHYADRSKMRSGKLLGTPNLIPERMEFTTVASIHVTQDDIEARSLHEYREKQRDLNMRQEADLAEANNVEAVQRSRYTFSLLFCLAVVVVLAIFSVAGHTWAESEHFTASPTLAPTPAPESSCFPADATVSLESGEVKSMQDLRIGDRVHQVDSHQNRDLIEPIYAWLHREPEKEASYIRITAGVSQIILSGSLPG
jgi:hypothetical protein